MNTIGSPFFVVSCLIAPTMPPTDTTSPSRRLGEPAVGLPPKLLADRLQRMLRDVDAERFLLHAQELVLVQLHQGHLRMLLRRRRRLLPTAEVEDRPLSGEPVGLHASTPR